MLELRPAQASRRVRQAAVEEEVRAQANMPRVSRKGGQGERFLEVRELWEREGGSGVLGVDMAQSTATASKLPRVLEDANAAVLSLRRDPDQGGMSTRAMEEQRGPRSHPEVLRLLASAMRGAQLRDVQGMQECNVHPGGEMQEQCKDAEREADAAVICRSALLPLRELPFCHLRDEGRRRWHLRQSSAQE